MRPTLALMLALAPCVALGDTPHSAPAYQQALQLPREADPHKTPGLARPNPTRTQICNTKWGEDQRAVTDDMKAETYEAYGIEVEKVDGKWQFPHYVINGKPRPLYEVDHKYSRELWGADDKRNLALQSYVGNCNAHDKDRLENRLHKEYCKGKIDLPDAWVALDHWVESYRTRFGSCTHPEQN